MGIKLSEQGKVAAAGETVRALEVKAKAAGMHVDQVNVTLLQEGGGGAQMVFEWDAAADEYTMRTL